MEENSLFNLHESLTGEKIKKKRRTVKQVENEIIELKKEIVLLKNLLKFYINDDWWEENEINQKIKL
jgi:hypothetical protein